VIDWRDMQQIKNDVCGESWEAIELYPDETRLVDPSNARYLFASPRRFRFGATPKVGRHVLDHNDDVPGMAAGDPLPPQRPLRLVGMGDDQDSAATTAAPAASTPPPGQDQPGGPAPTSENA
jgi:hypothetical protein